MKKKIKDLTLDECVKICSVREDCQDCPLLSRDTCVINDMNYLAMKISQLEKEIEVDD